MTMANTLKVAATKGLHASDVKEKGMRDGIRIGLTTGLKLTHFLNELMALNVKAQLNDDDLTEVVAREFPKRIANGLAIQAMSAYRSYANAGKHGHIAPKGPKGAERYGAIVRKASEGKAAKGKGKPAKGKAPKAKAKKAPKAKPVASEGEAA